MVALDPTMGAEIRKTRPAVVVQNDHSNRTASTTIVAPVTSRARPYLYPTEALVPRLVRRLGKLRPPTIVAVDRALLVTLALIDL